MIIITEICKREIKGERRRCKKIKVMIIIMEICKREREIKGEREGDVKDNGHNNNNGNF